MRKMASLLVLFGFSALAQANIVIDTVPVGNPGNAAEWSGQNQRGVPRLCGAVGYTYNIGKYEVTAGQYCAFLNAVAAADAHGLYSSGMGDVAGYYGCNIQRSGSPGNYTYSVAADWANRPVNWVCWADAARFANWMHNGQPVGPQNASTTEDGSYDLSATHSYYGPNGQELDWRALSAAIVAVTRKPAATWVITSEDEWYKAAYHKNDGVTGNYWEYPTCSDTVPANDLIDPDPGNTANCPNDSTGAFHYTIDSPYWRTEAGEFENSAGPYGTFDQGGNVREWTEGAIDSLCRVKRGGGYDWRDAYMSASVREFYIALEQDADIGFRLACVPEPATLAMLVLGRVNTAASAAIAKWPEISLNHRAVRRGRPSAYGFSRLPGSHNGATQARSQHAIRGLTAAERTRTSTILRSLGPEPSASANSATAADSSGLSSACPLPGADRTGSLANGQSGSKGCPRPALQEKLTPPRSARWASCRPGFPART